MQEKKPTEHRRVNPADGLHHLINGLIFTGDVAIDAPAFLRQHGCPKTALHVEAVARTAVDLAQRFGVDPALATQAGWLHDISAVIPDTERVGCALILGLDVLPEEQSLPMILHQRLSAVMAEQLFGITDPRILSAIGCHTTLQANASSLDKVVFTADKIAWDQQGIPPWLDALQAALNDSLDAGTCIYLQYLWDQREHLSVVHPWFRQAYLHLCVLPSPPPGGDGQRPGEGDIGT